VSNKTDSKVLAPHQGIGVWISQKQGLWGARDTGFSRSNGSVCDIRAFKVHFSDKEKLELRGFSFSAGEELWHDEITVGGLGPTTNLVSTNFTLQTHLRSSIHDST